jgi:hypothetical protein
LICLSYYINLCLLFSLASTLPVNLAENVAPTVTGASLTDTNKITLTFSKAVTNAIGTDDFDVYVGGTELASSGVTTATSATGVTTLTVTVPTLSAAQVASGIVVKADNNLNVTDTDLNALNFSSITVK